MKFSRAFAVFIPMLVVYSLPFAQRQMYPPWPPQNLADSWEFKKDPANDLAMTSHFTYGAIDRWLTIVPGKDSFMPLSGTCRFPNGFSRAMTEGELNYFWVYGGAQHAWQKYLHNLGQLRTFNPSPEKPIEREWFGKDVVCITVADKYFVGRLQLTSVNSELVQLKANGASKPITIYLNQIKELRAIK